MYYSNCLYTFVSLRVKYNIALINNFNTNYINSLIVMTKNENTCAAPVSKYAAKKEKAAKEAIAVETPNEVETPTENKPFKKKVVKKEFPNTFPEHQVNLACIIKNNAEIRRFTSLGILNYLLQKGEIKGTKKYVSFKWNKFTVKCDGLIREYFYTEPFFLNCLTASFASFAASAQKTIDIFCKKEMGVGINKAVDEEEVKEIVESTEEYVNNNGVEPEVVE